MKKEKIIDALNDIDDKYIEEAKQKKKFVFDWAFVGKLLTGVVAVFLVVTIVPNLIKTGSGLKNGYAASTAEAYIPMPEEAPAAAAQMADMAYEEAGYSDGSLNYSNNRLSNPALQNKKLIVNGYMNVETANFDETIEILNRNVEEYGGYIQSSSINAYSANGRFFDATIRIPADKYQDFINKAKENGNVTYYNESVEDITETYSDLQARLKSLKSEEEKVLKFYDQATNLEELMSVEARLTDIRYQIDSIETNIKNYDLLVNYSTLNISIQETKVYTNTKTSFFSRIGMAFSNGFTNFVEAVQDLFVGIVYNIWTILIIAVVVIVAIIVIKKIRNKNK